VRHKSGYSARDESPETGVSRNQESKYSKTRRFEKNA